MRKPIVFILAMAALCLLTVPTLAQESRGTVLGTVRDAQDAVVPGAEIVVANVATNQSRSTVSNDTGYYEVPFLDPGEYTISAELAGFKKYVRSGVTVNVASKVRIDVKLEIGEVAQVVEVAGEAPLLDTTSASAGRVIDTAQIASLPFSDLNPFALSAMAPGMQWDGQPEYRRPFDNGGTSAFNTAGGVGQNEYAIDGAPVTGTGRRVGFVPPADAVQEFTLQTAAFDASVGHTSGAVINVMSRTGTNQFHGSLYDQHWQQRWNATPHFTRIAYEKNVKDGKIPANSERQAPGRSNQFGATLGGPVRIPWLYNGTDKFFFFFSYNGIYQKKAETTGSIYRSVPKMAWRDGDFSDLLAIDPAKYQIYDPRTARMVGSQVVRDPFQGNKGIPILNPMYKHYIKLYPVPNNVPGVVGADGANNYYATNMPKDERFNSILNRYDYNISDRQRIAGKWFWNHRLADEYDWTYETARGLHTNGLTRINKGGSGDYTWTINNNNIFQASLSWARFNEGAVSPVRTTYKPTDVGLPQYINDRAADFTMLPRIDFDSTEDISDSWPSITIRGTTGELKLSMVSIIRSHSLKYGWQERRYWTTTAGPGNASGYFSFRNSYMRKTDTDNVAVNRGLEWAAFMMGLPSNSISIDRNDSAIWSTPFRSFYIHDDWRVSPKLSLNLGLRYEREAGITERFNRGITGGFDPTLTLPITALAQAAYAKVYADNAASSKPIAGLPDPAGFKVLGGSHYLGETGFKTFTKGTHQLLPRFGAVYRILDKTVLRLGYGWFQDTLNTNNDRPRQDGYSQSTGTTLSSDRGISFCCGVGEAANLSGTANPLLNPFPVRADGTRFEEPFGNSLGSMIRVGRGWDNAYAWEGRPALQHRWRLGIQHEIATGMDFFSDMVVEVAYTGAYAKGPLGDRFRIDALPKQYWATGNARNNAIDTDLNQTLNNPFYIDNFKELQTSNPKLYNYMATAGFFTTKTIRKHQLLRPFVHMNGLYAFDLPGLSFADVYGEVGANQYNDMQLSFEKRMSKGVQTAFAYTKTFNSKEKDWRANEFDREMTWRPTNQVRPNRVVWQTIWQLPFGRNQLWAKEGVLEKLAGGWELNWIFQWQDGQPLEFGNRFFYGDINQLENLWNHDEVWGSDVHQWFSKDITWNPSANPTQNNYCVTNNLGANCDPPSSFVGFEGRSAKQPGSYHVRMTPSRFPKLLSHGINNWDIKVMRRFRIREQMNTSFSVDFLNAFNHTNFSGPNTDPTSPNFGLIGAQRGLSRTIQFNLRLDF